MFGVLTVQDATKVVIVCGGGFTRDALIFAENKPINLVGGAELLEMVKGVQVNSKINAEHLKATDESSNKPKKHCPNCGNQLVERKAKRGVNAGNTFLGCSSFPKCRFTTDNASSQPLQG